MKRLKTKRQRKAAERATARILAAIEKERADKGGWHKLVKKAWAAVREAEERDERHRPVVLSSAFETNRRRH